MPNVRKILQMRQIFYVGGVVVGGGRHKPFCVGGGSNANVQNVAVDVVVAVENPAIFVTFTTIGDC